ncbi:PREDICTED: epidermal growth factor receptor kinase substrate 8-like protein 2 isoform X2 [Branchiostoma belcheri]|uniref:Epidermal growth factor receptor kinase substrate 8-like protein 2 isoform X2 n=1 Tax=Branchiostoma belcheri TaxID=7741 RepID=A0A6P4YQP0_BRABE|nr:PREDICTED: epidermal growth factor receptor kinase substrate 8-like protein 2 isoform X2 [Branchiostoma belcheri]
MTNDDSSVYYDEYLNRPVLDELQSEADLEFSGPIRGRRDSIGMISEGRGARDVYERRKQMATYGDSQLTRSTQYPVKHLMTIPVDRGKEEESVQDALLRLDRMEARGELWIQDAVLDVGDDVRLVDQGTGELLENLDPRFIQMNRSQRGPGSLSDLFLLVYQSPDSRKEELFVFQCDEYPSDVLNNEISKVMDRPDLNGYDMAPLRNSLPAIQPRAPSVRDDDLPPLTIAGPPAAIIPYYPPSRPTETSYVSKSFGPPVSAVSQPYVAAEPPIPVQDVTHQYRYYDDANKEIVNVVHLDSAPKAKTKDEFLTDRYVDILNHVIDEIEAFSLDLDQMFYMPRPEAGPYGRGRSKKRKRGKKGQVQYVAPPPPMTPAPNTHDYADVLGKFKYAFNLATRVRAYIRNPNAAELIHMLFGMLRRVVQTCPDPDLPRQVVSPLLTLDAVRLIPSATITEDVTFWRSLGPAWTTPREEWPYDEYVPPYLPRFRDGWAPAQVADEINLPIHPDLPSVGATHTARVVPKAAESSMQRAASLDRLDQLDAQPEQLPVSEPFEQNGYRIEDDQTSMATTNTQRYRSVSASRQGSRHGTRGPHCKARVSFDARNSHELSIVKGEKLEIRDASRQRWWRVRNRAGDEGFVPSSFIDLGDGTSRAASVASSVRARSSHGRSRSRSRSRKRAPSVPREAVGTYSVPPSEAALSVRSRRRRKSGDKRSRSRSEGKRRSRSSKSRSGSRRRSRSRSRGTQVDEPGPVTHDDDDDEGLTYDSSPDDVRLWLKKNGFSRNAMDYLGVLTGTQLFSLTKAELQLVCGEEGGKVYEAMTHVKSKIQGGKTRH